MTISPVLILVACDLDEQPYFLFASLVQLDSYVDSKGGQNNNLTRDTSCLYPAPGTLYLGTFYKQHQKGPLKYNLAF